MPTAKRIKVSNNENGIDAEYEGNGVGSRDWESNAGSLGDDVQHATSERLEKYRRGSTGNVDIMSAHSNGVRPLVRSQPYHQVARNIIVQQQHHAQNGGSCIDRSPNYAASCRNNLNFTQQKSEIQNFCSAWTAEQQSTVVPHNAQHCEKTSQWHVSLGASRQQLGDLQQPNPSSLRNLREEDHPRQMIPSSPNGQHYYSVSAHHYQVPHQERYPPNYQRPSAYSAPIRYSPQPPSSPKVWQCGRCSRMIPYHIKPCPCAKASVRNFVDRSNQTEIANSQQHSPSTWQCPKCSRIYPIATQSCICSEAVAHGSAHFTHVRMSDGFQQQQRQSQQHPLQSTGYYSHNSSGQNASGLQPSVICNETRQIMSERTHHTDYHTKNTALLDQQTDNQDSSRAYYSSQAISHQKTHTESQSRYRTKKKAGQKCLQHRGLIAADSLTVIDTFTQNRRFRPTSCDIELPPKYTVALPRGKKASLLKKLQSRSHGNGIDSVKRSDDDGMHNSNNSGGIATARNGNTANNVNSINSVKKGLIGRSQPSFDHIIENAESLPQLEGLRHQVKLLLDKIENKIKCALVNKALDEFDGNDAIDTQQSQTNSSERSETDTNVQRETCCSRCFSFVASNDTSSNECPICECSNVCKKCKSSCHKCSRSICDDCILACHHCNVQFCFDCRIAPSTETQSRELCQQCSKDYKPAPPIGQSVRKRKSLFAHERKQKRRKSNQSNYMNENTDVAKSTPRISHGHIFEADRKTAEKKTTNRQTSGIIESSKGDADKMHDLAPLRELTMPEAESSTESKNSSGGIQVHEDSHKNLDLSRRTPNLEHESASQHELLLSEVESPTVSTALNDKKYARLCYFSPREHATTTQAAGTSTHESRNDVSRVPKHGGATGKKNTIEQGRHAADCAQEVIVLHSNSNESKEKPTGFDVLPSPLYSNGTELYKKFVDESIGKKRPFKGTIESYDMDAGFYKIVYEDGCVYFLHVIYLCVGDSDNIAYIFKIHVILQG